MKRFKRYEEFINEMKINKYPKFVKLDLEDVHKYVEPHPTYDFSFSYYEKIGSFGLSLVGGEDIINYDDMDPSIKKLYDKLPKNRRGGNSPLKGDFIDTFEIAIFDWEGEDVTKKFTDNSFMLTLDQVNDIRKKIFDTTKLASIDINKLLSGKRRMNMN